MNSFASIRQAACELRTSLGSPYADSVDGRSLLVAAMRLRELELGFRPRGDLTLNGALAVFNRRFQIIFCVDDIPHELATYYIAHEIGHAVLHSEPEICSERDMNAYGQGVGGGAAQKVEAYGAKERKEAQSNVFAREFLLPRQLARKLFIERAMGSRAIAAELGLPLEIVRQQLADALLLPEMSSLSEIKPKRERMLDPSQEAAAKHMGSPLLLEAGPGTGKTGTLVARVLYLLAQGMDPTSILVLTFSNKAATEFRERIAQAVSIKAAQLWAGTFHAFGLELIRKHHDALGLPSDLRVLDHSDALDLVEEELATLPDAYLDLWEPARELKHVLKAISRAKDELVGPEQYRALSLAMIEAASCDEDREAGAKAMEVARIYKAYEEALSRANAVDFGDLVMKSVLLLRSNEQVRATVKAQYRHVLVDEYQDVNRATACLIREIADDERPPWIVGDSRQSIYRFRGASAANMVRFDTDYPSAQRKALSINYRSSKGIVDAFQAFARTMHSSDEQLPLELEAQRGSGGTPPALHVLPDEATEADAVAGAIQSLSSAGIAYRDQAVLCCSNSELSRFAEELQARGIPVLHLGALFARSEVRDLICLLWAIVDKSGGAMVRLAEFPEYRVPLTDLHLLLQEAHHLGERPFKLLAHVEQLPGLSEEGARGLMLMGKHLADVGEGAMPWHLLMEYLFDRSAYLKSVLLGDDVPTIMRRIAIWQLASAVREMPVIGNGPPIRRMLERIRRMIVLDEERELRNLPPEAEAMNAVRLLTVHASKGLEFEAVHLPGLTIGTFPRKKQTDRCPPPKDLIEQLPGYDEDRARDEEEECLFFVALSRAKSHLRLYRPSKRRGKNASPAEFLSAKRLMVEQVPAEVLRSRMQPRRAEDGIERLKKAVGPFSPAEIESYEKCPRRYFYDYVLGLKPEDRNTAFLKTHRCIKDALDYAKSCGDGREYDKAVAEQLVNAAWAAKGPSEHAFRHGYWLLLQRMLSQLNNAHEGYVVSKGEEWEVPLGSGRIVVRADQVARRADGTQVVRRFRTGRASRNEADKLSYTLYHVAAREKLASQNVVVEAVHLTAIGGAINEISQTTRKMENRLDICKNIISGILSCRFPAQVDEQQCIRCPYYFICPSAAAKQVELPAS